MFTLRLCAPPCHTQNEKAPHHRTTFHGADVDLLMKKKINMYQKIYVMFIYFFILVLFLFILLWCLLIVLRQMHARIQEIISWGGGCGGYIVCGGGSGSGSGGQSPFSIFRELSDPFLDPRMKCKPLYIYFSLRFRALICNSNIYN